MVNLWIVLVCRNWIIHAAPAMPPQAWGITACVFLILAIAAVIDACIGIVPDVLVLLGMLLVGLAHFGFGNWFAGGVHLAQGALAWLIIWSVNQIWYMIFKRDALGMGDGKWTMVAVACFGVIPAVIAWGAGAILGLIFMGVMRLTQKEAWQIHFAPFLFAGLCLGIKYLYFSS